jgi:dTDP-4-amino-4,6-dideoxygalactose transaminase
MTSRMGPRILLIGGTYRALCVLERLLDRGNRVVAFIGVEGSGERDFCPEILEICDRASIPARSGHKLGEEIVRWLEDRIRPELAIAVGVRTEVPVAIGGNCRLGLLEVVDMFQSDSCPGIALRQRGQAILTKDLGGPAPDEDPGDRYVRMIDALINSLDEYLDRITPREGQLPPSVPFERSDWEPLGRTPLLDGVGEETLALEREVAAYTGAQHVFPLRSTRDAFGAVARALGLGEGAEVVCPGITSAAALEALGRLGIRAHAIDVHPERLTLDPQRAAEALQPRSRALLISHALGQPADLERLYALAADRELEVIEDATEALGAHLGDSRIGRSPCTCVFRLPLGPSSSGLEAALVTAPAALAERLEPLVKEQRLGDRLARAARRELAQLDARISARRSNASGYSSELVRYDAFRIPPTPARALSTYSSYLLRLTRFARTSAEDLVKLLAEAGIEARRPAFGVRDRELASLPAAESARATGLLLPVEPQLSDADRERVLDAIFGYAIG